ESRSWNNPGARRSTSKTELTSALEFSTRTLVQSPKKERFHDHTAGCSACCVRSCCRCAAVTDRICSDPSETRKGKDGLQGRPQRFLLAAPQAGMPHADRVE